MYLSYFLYILGYAAFACLAAWGLVYYLNHHHADFYQHFRVIDGRRIDDETGETVLFCEPTAQDESLGIADLMDRIGRSGYRLAQQRETERALKRLRPEERIRALCWGKSTVIVLPEEPEEKDISTDISPPLIALIKNRSAFA